MVRHMLGVTDEERQERREQVRRTVARDIWNKCAALLGARRALAALAAAFICVS